MSKFYAIQAIPGHSDDWELIGVLTNECDVLSFVDECKGSGNYLAVARPQHLDMVAILDVLVRDRLRELAEPVIAIAGCAENTTNSAITKEEHRKVLGDAAPGVSDIAAELLVNLELMVEAHGYSSYRTDEEKEADPDVIKARSIITKAKSAGLG